MKTPDKIFIDTNILVYATNRKEPLGEQAYSKLSSLQDKGSNLFISSQTLKEYANAMIRKAINQKADLHSTILKVQNNIDDFQNQFELLLETNEVVLNWRNMLPMLQSNKQVYDYYIAATMNAYNISIIFTHNVSDFKGFEGITVMPLL